MRDWPTAKSAMSIISCTSPSPSALILPFSSDDEAAERVLVRAQLFGHESHRFAALRRRHLAPFARMPRRPTASRARSRLAVEQRTCAINFAGRRIDGVDERPVDCPMTSPRCRTRFRDSRVRDFRCASSTSFTHAFTACCALVARLARRPPLAEETSFVPPAA